MGDLGCVVADDKVEVDDDVFVVVALVVVTVVDEGVVVDEADGDMSTVSVYMHEVEILVGEGRLCKYTLKWFSPKGESK